MVIVVAVVIVIVFMNTNNIISILNAGDNINYNNMIVYSLSEYFGTVVNPKTFF